MLGGFGENAAHGDPALFQASDEIERFVGGDAAADDQQHAFCSDGGRGAPGRLCAAFACAAGGRDFDFGGGAAQDGAHLILDRAAVARRAQAELLLERFVELPDGEGGHGKSRYILKT